MDLTYLLEQFLGSTSHSLYLSPLRVTSGVALAGMGESFKGRDLTPELVVAWKSTALGSSKLMENSLRKYKMQ